jgi:CPA2 family monovalent cation:H+ antiporter-2
MPEVNFLRELVIILAATVSTVFLFQKLKVPSIVGFLLAGVLLGPQGIRLIPSIQGVQTLADIGVVLLLFTIGVEFSMAQLASIQRYIVVAGAAQIVLTVVVVLGLFVWVGFPWEGGLFYGFLIALSSTAIVFKVLSDRRETATLHGRIATGVLLLQDLSVIPMMLVVPLLGEAAARSIASISWTIVQAVLAVPLIVFVARYAFPWLIEQVVRLKNREVFILFVVFFSLGTAWITSEFGLSVALGAFIAGLVVSESDYSHQIESEILPLKDCFSGIFFISVGMLLDVRFVLSDLRSPLANLLLLILIKGGVIGLIFWWLYGSVRIGMVLALHLAQVGEFSFVIAKVGRELGLMTPVAEQAFLAASILSMIATPFLIAGAHGAAFALEAVLGQGWHVRDQESASALGNHVIIVGFGLNGQNLSRVLKEVGIGYKILELDPEVVKLARAQGEPVVFGDGTHAEVLRQIGVEVARVLVVAISDTAATARVVRQARALNHELFIIVRTRYVWEIERLYGLGANQVIPEEFETSVEIFARVLQEFHIPRNVIAMQVDLIRRERYGMLRGLKLEGKSLDQLGRFLVGTTADTCLILDGSPAVGRSLEELELRARSGVTVIAVVRGGQSTHNPGPGFRLQAGDVLIFLGAHAELDRATEILSPEPGAG